MLKFHIEINKQTNNIIPWRFAISNINANTSFTENHTEKASNNSIRDFSILKLFSVTPPQFSCYLTSYQAELCGAMRAIEVASESHWLN